MSQPTFAELLDKLIVAARVDCQTPPAMGRLASARAAVLAEYGRVVAQAVLADRRYCLFVYGTLKRGHGNNCLLQTATFLREAALNGYQMFASGCPVIAAGEGTVYGELYEIDDATLYRCDQLEGVPNFYQRTKVTLMDGTQAWAYTQRVGYGQPVASGRWERNF